MELDNKDYQDIEELSGCSYSPEKIAVYLDVDIKEFLSLWHDKNSKVRYHYERGIIITQAESDKKQVAAAKTGNTTSYQQVLKQQYFQKIENRKKEILLDSVVDDIDNLKRFLNSGDVTGLPADQVALYKKLDFARPLINANESKDSVVNHLMLSFPGEFVSRKQAEQIYFEAINFFNCNSDVTNQAWNNYFAELNMKGALLAWELSDLKMHKEYLHEARICRLEANVKNEFPDEMYRKQRVIYINDPKRFKVARVDRQITANWIDNLPEISEEDKIRLHRDNQSEEVEYEILTPPEKNAEDQN